MNSHHFRLLFHTVYVSHRFQSGRMKINHVMQAHGRLGQNAPLPAGLEQGLDTILSVMTMMFITRYY